jgi:hypothetical protein
MYGDGGAYIECTPASLSNDNVKLKETRYYFDLWETKDSSVVFYQQKRPVTDRPNPPPSASYRDVQFRPEGYAGYQKGKVYINPDDVFLEKNEKRFPAENKTLKQLQEEEENKEDALSILKRRSLVFTNCAFVNPAPLQKFLVDNKVSDESVVIQEVFTIGRKVAGKTQLVKAVFAESKQADQVFANKNRLKGKSTIWVHRALDPEEARERRAVQERKKLFPLPVFSSRFRFPHFPSPCPAFQPAPPPFSALYSMPFPLEKRKPRSVVRV